jgi:protein TonB
MASPVEAGQHLPDTLPADFGEWDSSDSQVAPPAETPAVDPREVAPKETPQRKSARREAESLDSGKKANTSREVSREFEPARNVTPFPEPDPASLTSRGFPAPAMRAPRTSPGSTLSVDPVVQEDSNLLGRMKSKGSVLETLPTAESRIEIVGGSAVPLLGRKPDKPLFSSLALEELETVETNNGPRSLTDLLEEEEERKAKRKWIMSGCAFGVAFLLVAFQLLHYGSAGRIKHIVAPTQAAATTADLDPASIDVKHPGEKPSPIKQLNEESQPAENASTGPAETTPVPVVGKEMMQTQLSAPTRLPQSAKSVAPSDAPPPAALGGASIAALNGNNSAGNLFAQRYGANISGPKQVTVSAGVAVGMLTHRTQPLYPAIARSARVQGTVVLQAKISPTGKVTNLQVITGPPMLRQSAIDAVKTWQYKPFTLDGQPTEVDTTINVVFSLGG